MSKQAFVFPGQGSQFSGMGKNLYEQNDAAKALFEKANEILLENSNTRFLIQSDETEFIEKMTTLFPNSFYFKDEARHMSKRNSTVDKVFKNFNYRYAKFYLAITIIMSKCKAVVCGSSGNCSIWIAFYRGNADNLFQYFEGSLI